MVAVCDMDNFKDVNDRYGHLVGDEILRNIGNLLQASIRHEDEAFRWGGDEFVILFHNQQADVARRRMADIETRLRDFRVRGFGVLPITFSWGTAEASGRRLRDALDEADRNMYALKRSRAGSALRRAAAGPLRATSLRSSCTMLPSAAGGAVSGQNQDRNLRAGQHAARDVEVDLPEPGEGRQARVLQPLFPRLVLGVLHAIVEIRSVDD